ncbi:hypothetical protein V1478_009127 [Vespula squamosa]|uniref:Uncharacterized protein n=1 Tax=Vespula squamosa TaxID=30214 RepID=A0ABD2ANR3_VESSQ
MNISPKKTKKNLCYIPRKIHSQKTANLRDSTTDPLANFEFQHRDGEFAALLTFQSCETETDLGVACTFRTTSRTIERLIDDMSNSGTGTGNYSSSFSFAYVLENEDSFAMAKYRCCLTSTTSGRTTSNFANRDK